MKMKEFGPPGGARVPGAPLGSANAKYVVVRLFTQSHHPPLHSTVCGELLIQISKKNKATGNKKIAKLFETTSNSIIYCER